MKIIFLIAFILILSLASSKIVEVKKAISRSIAPEDVALELEFYGSCQEFKDRVLPSIWISKHARCLPIQVGVAENPDNNDLHTHYFCTNKRRSGRSIIHFVEIYEEYQTAYPDFVLSLVPSNPFRVLTRKTSLARKPDCFVTHDYCNATNAVVNGCRTNEVVRQNGYIVSHDRIYITAHQNVSFDCKFPETECCGYIQPTSFGGICDNHGSNDLLNFPKGYDNDRHDNDRHGNNHHDDDRHDNDRHGNNHHDNDRHGDDRRPGRPGDDRRPGNSYDNDRHDNDRHDNDRHGDDRRPGRPGDDRRPGPGRQQKQEEDDEEKK